MKDQHALSSNLPHLEAVLLACHHAPSVSAVMQSFRYTPSGGRGSKVVLVDVVACGGGAWVKIFARKRSALHLYWLGGAHGSERSVTVVAEEFLEASKQNQCRFDAPKIIFAFFDGITESVAGELAGLGVATVGTVFPDDSAMNAPSYEEVAAILGQVAVERPLCGGCERVNMDVSSLVAWSSQMIRGGAQYKYQDFILEQQAAGERATPTLPQLEALTKGKRLIVCRTAFENFTSILETIGGPREKDIGRSLLQTLEVVPDSPSERALKLLCKGKIKERSKVVFGTGDYMKAITLTANEGFVRAACSQGVHFDVAVHSSRALSEMQQLILRQT